MKNQTKRKIEEFEDSLSQFTQFLIINSDISYRQARNIIDKIEEIDKLLDEVK